MLSRKACVYCVRISWLWWKEAVIKPNVREFLDYNRHHFFLSTLFKIRFQKAEALILNLCTFFFNSNYQNLIRRFYEKSYFCIFFAGFFPPDSDYSIFIIWFSFLELTRKNRKNPIFWQPWSNAIKFASIYLRTFNDFVVPYSKAVDNNAYNLSKQYNISTIM